MNCARKKPEVCVIGLVDDGSPCNTFLLWSGPPFLVACVAEHNVHGKNILGLFELCRTLRVNENRRGVIILWWWWSWLTYSEMVESTGYGLIESRVTTLDTTCHTCNLPLDRNVWHFFGSLRGWCGLSMVMVMLMMLMLMMLMLLVISWTCCWVRFASVNTPTQSPESRRMAPRPVPPPRISLRTGSRGSGAVRCTRKFASCRLHGWSSRRRSQCIGRPDSPSCSALSGRTRRWCSPLLASRVTLRV